jgi:hypothetical protein
MKKLKVSQGILLIGRACFEKTLLVASKLK